MYLTIGKKGICLSDLPVWCAELQLVEEELIAHPRPQRIEHCTQSLTHTKKRYKSSNFIVEF